MSIKSLLILSWYFISNACFSQAVEKEWDRFQSEDWDVEYVANKPTVFGKKSQGVLQFRAKYKLDTKSVSYFIIRETDYDQKLKNEIADWLFKQSCLSTSSAVEFRSFTFGEYYYQLVPCDNCPTQHKTCETLALAIEEFVKAK